MDFLNNAVQEAGNLFQSIKSQMSGGDNSASGNSSNPLDQISSSINDTLQNVGSNVASSLGEGAANFTNTAYQAIQGFQDPSQFLGDQTDPINSTLNQIPGLSNIRGMNAGIMSALGIKQPLMFFGGEMETLPEGPLPSFLSEQPFKPPTQGEQLPLLESGSTTPGFNLEMQPTYKPSNQLHMPPPFEGDNGLIQFGVTKGITPEGYQQLESVLPDIQQNRFNYDNPQYYKDTLLKQDTADQFLDNHPDFNNHAGGAQAMADKPGFFGYVPTDTNTVPLDEQQTASIIDERIASEWTQNNGDRNIAILREDPKNPGTFEIIDAHHGFPTARAIGLDKMPAFILSDLGLPFTDAYQGIKDGTIQPINIQGGIPLNRQLQGTTGAQTGMSSGQGEQTLSPEETRQLVPELFTPEGRAELNQVIEDAKRVAPELEARLRLLDQQVTGDPSVRAEDLPYLRQTRPGSYTNVATVDNPLLLGENWQQARASQPMAFGMNEPPQPPPTSGGNRFNDFFNPLANQPEDFQAAIREWDASQKVARVNANALNLQNKDLVNQLGITPQQEWALVNYSQNPTPERLALLQRLGYDIDKQLVDTAKPLLDLHKQTNEDIFNRAKDAGIPVDFLQNHIRQSFAQSPQEIYQILQGKGLSGLPGFSFHRTIPDYLEAGNYGLTPRYTTFGQANSQALEELERALANSKLAKTLTGNNYIVPTSQAPRGFKPIQSDYFPRTQDNEIYMANPKMAEVLNNIFGGTPQSPISSALDFTGRLSGALQSLKLSTGGYSIHGFTIANLIKDTAMALGDAFSGHPIRGAQTVGGSLGAMFRAFVPGAGENFERSHMGAIKEMAEQGIGYGGILDYRNAQENVAPKPISPQMKAGQIKDNIWENLIDIPTFKKFMFQRKVSLYEGMKQALLNQGKTQNEAVSLAADQLKQYDGMVQDLGRNPDVKNFLRTFFFAPKYRETVIGSGVNAVKSILDPRTYNNPDYSFSRRLALGLVATYLLYNELNKKNTGKNMWENPPGREFEVLFPQAGGKKFFSIPWMPGSTAPFRMAAGTGLSLAKGATDEALKAASGVLSSPLQTLTEAFGTKKDFFGRDLFNQNQPLLPQQLGYVAQQSLLPGSVNEIVKTVGQATQGKDVNPLVTLARAFQLPIKEGSFPNPYFQGVKDIPTRLGFDTNDLSAWQTLHPQTKDANGNTIYQKGLLSKQQAAILYMNNPKLQAAEVLAAQQNPNHDPLWDLPADQRQQVLFLRSMMPGTTSQIKQQITSQPWYQDFRQQESQYFQNLQTQGVNVNSNQVSPQLQAKLDMFSKLPQGTGARKAFIANNADVAAYFAQNQQNTNQLLSNLNLPQLPQQPSFQTSTSGFGSSGGGTPAMHKFASNVRRIAMPRARANYIKSYLKNKPVGTRNAHINFLHSKGLLTSSVGHYMTSHLPNNQQITAPKISALKQVTTSGFQQPPIQRVNLRYLGRPYIPRYGKYQYQ